MLRLFCTLNEYFKIHSGPFRTGLIRLNIQNVGTAWVSCGQLTGGSNDLLTMATKRLTAGSVVSHVH